MKIKAENVEAVLTLDHPFLNNILLLFNLETCEKISEKLGIPLTNSNFKYSQFQKDLVVYKSLTEKTMPDDIVINELINRLRGDLNKANLENELLSKEFTFYKTKP